MDHERHPLQTVRQKLAAARRTAAGLEQSLAEFDQAPSWQVMTSDRAEGDHPAYIFRAGQIPAAEWEDDVFTISTRCRSALDNLVAAVAHAHGAPAAELTGGFPIFPTEARYRAPASRGGPTRRDALLRGVPDGARLVIDDLQPFRSAKPHQHPLARLNTIRNEDTHRLGYPQFAGLRSFTFALSSPRERTVRGFSFTVDTPDSGPGRRLEDGVDLLAFVPDAQWAAAERAMTQLDAWQDPEKHVLFLPRIGIGFGPAHLFFHELVEIIDFIEQRVVAELEPWVTHQR